MVDKLAELRRKVDGLQTAADRAAGASDNLLKELEEKYGCKTLKEAEAATTKAAAKATAAEAAYNKALASFEQEWGDILNEVGDG